MAVKKMLLEDMTTTQAMDNLTSMADLDKDVFAKKGKQSKQKSPKWLDLQNDENTVENIKQTFKVLNNYLKDVYKKDKSKLAEEETQNGIRAIMVLAGEAVQKIDRYTNLIEKGVIDRSVTEFEEYRALQEFYQKKMIKKFQKAPDAKDFWKEEWGDVEDLSVDVDIEVKGIKDLETVKEDTGYELFHIKRENGKRFFDRSLLRHIKLVNDFDHVVLSEVHEDPFLMLQKVQDKDAFESAKEIKGAVFTHLKVFLKAYQHIHSSEFYIKITHSVHALILATSHHNLMESGSKKTCYQYLRDFSMYLREGFLSTDYHAHSEEFPEDLDSFIRDLMLFAYELCWQFFLHIGPKDHMIGFINRLMDKVGVGEKEKVKPSMQMWTALLEGYDHLQNVLKKYPNGPLFKALDNFSEESYDVFEPLAQENFPGLLYYIENEALKVSVLRMPSPTRQEIINKAEVSIGFESFIKSLRSIQKNQKLLFINLQDRSSWKEHARCQLIEEMPKQSHFVDILEVCTLAKDNIFYHQLEDYEELIDASDFTKLLKEQLFSGEECGFYFSKMIAPSYLEGFIAESIQLIHQCFFGKKDILSHKNRLDFIEIFYFFFILKLIDILKPSHIALSCKDAIDTGPAAYAGLFAFLKLFSQDDKWSREEEDFFVWMMQSPALLHRERAIHAQRYQRTINALAVVNAELDVDKHKIVAAFEKLYGYAIFKNIKVSEAKS